MDAAEDSSVLRAICMQDIDLIIDAGFNKAINNLELINKAEFTRTLKVHYTLLRCKAELDQLSCGLSTLGIGDAFKKYPAMFAPLFTSSSLTQLTQCKKH